MNHPAVPLRRITTCLDGRRIPLNATERSQTPGDIPYWGSGGVVDTVGDYLFDEPLVLLGEDGAPFFDPVRPVAFRTTGKVWVNNHIHVLRPFNSDPRFLTHALNAVDYSAYITGSTRDKLTQEDMNEIEVPNPPLPEQRRIADFLDDQVTRIDKAIQLRKRQAALVAERQKAFLISAYFDDRTPLTRVGRVAVIQHGRQRSPENEAGDHMTPYIRSANVSDGSIDVEDVKRMNFSPKEQAVYALAPGDVLLTEASGSVAAIGASAAWSAPIHGVVCFQNHLLRLRAKPEQLNAEYLLWWARASYAAGAMQVWATGANILNLGSDSVKRMPIPARSPAAQQEVVRSCDEGDKRIRRLALDLSHATTLLEERKRSLITAAVTGEFDVSSVSVRASGVAMGGSVDQ